MTTEYEHDWAPSEEESASSGIGGVMVAFIAGAAVGAAVALLYAPAAGEETRRKVAGAARDMTQKARRGAQQVQGNLGDSWQRAVDAAKNAFEAALQRD
ncbi:MAG TPA: YtxH domain-containing protein [Candidatus Polarisedimenticolia bacterium]|jgi:gas vesicle protein|nr:YtxH domain-containing protein [Candidatus Polarisedimenticolia bacterium]